MNLLLFEHFTLEIARAEAVIRSEEHTSELQSHHETVCRLLLEKKHKDLDQRDAIATKKPDEANQTMSEAKISL